MEAEAALHCDGDGWGIYGRRMDPFIRTDIYRRLGPTRQHLTMRTHLSVGLDFTPPPPSAITVKPRGPSVKRAQ